MSGETQISKQERDRQRKREIENQLLELRERLEDGGVLSAEQIDVRVQKERDWIIDQWKAEEEVEERRRQLELEEEERRKQEQELEKKEASEIAGEEALVSVPVPAAQEGDPESRGDRQRHRSYPDELPRRRRDYHDDRRGQRSAERISGRSRDETNAHVRALLKERENDRLRSAFGIRPESHVEGL